jgi:hypothetical protein
VWAGGVSLEEAGQAATAQLTRLVDRAQVQFEQKYPNFTLIEFFALKIILDNIFAVLSYGIFVYFSCFKLFSLHFM